MAIPEYLRVMSDFSRNDVLFLGVNGVETPELIRSFLEKKSWDNFPNLLDFDGELARRMKVNGIRTRWLLDRMASSGMSILATALVWRRNSAMKSKLCFNSGNNCPQWEQLSQLFRIFCDLLSSQNSTNRGHVVAKCESITWQGL